MLLNVHISNADDVADQLNAISQQIQKVNEELSILRGMILDVHPLRLSLHDEKMPSES